MKNKGTVILSMLLIAGSIGVGVWYFFFKDKGEESGQGEGESIKDKIFGGKKDEDLKVGDSIKPTKNVWVTPYKEKNAKMVAFPQGQVIGTVMNINVPELDKSNKPTGTLLIFINGLDGKAYRGNMKDFVKN